MRKQIVGQITFEELEISLAEENTRQKMYRRAKRETDRRKQIQRRNNFCAREYD